MSFFHTIRTFFFKDNIEVFAARWPRNMNEAAVEREVDSLLTRMSLREKIAQMSGDGSHAILLKLGIYVLGLKRFPNIYSGYNERLGIPPLSFTDGPRGIVIGNATCFPAAMTRGASFDRTLEERIGAAIGLEARASGANYFAGLCVNLLRHPAWGRAQETYGEDNFHLGTMGIALMRGVQAQNVMVCSKHFAVNSIENSRFYLDVAIDEKTLHEVYLPHFKMLVDAGVDSLMSAYNQVNGEYCGHSSKLLHNILREQWGFKGFVSSDWLWGIYETVKPANAGMDIEMPRGHYYARRLYKAVKCGDVSQEKIDTSVRRILTAKLRWITALPEMKLENSNLIACHAHRELARKSAEQSMVLLSNNGILPWSEKNLANKTIAVIGELAAIPCLGDNGSSRVSPPQITTFLDGLRQRADSSIRIVYSDGRDIAQAADIARRADTVLMVAGYYADDEGENLTSNRQPVANPKVPRGGDRASLALSDHQQKLINAVCEANNNTVMTLVAGSAVMMNGWQNKPAAILFAGYAGMEGGHALANILFGDVNPSGKLPFTIPANDEQLPTFDRWAATAHYDYFHGYALIDKLQQAPAFAFGFGLSYTTFLISAALNKQEYCSDETINIAVTVSNTGNCAGAEVIQCYIGQLNPTEQPTPVKKLQAFEKVWLTSGEQKTVTLQIPVKNLARYDAEKQEWRVAAGEYQIEIGNTAYSSKKHSTASFTINVAPTGTRNNASARHTDDKTPEP